jgi:hypothetical protein
MLEARCDAEASMKVGIVVLIMSLVALGTGCSTYTRTYKHTQTGAVAKCQAWDTIFTQCRGGFCCSMSLASERHLKECAYEMSRQGYVFQNGDDIHRACPSPF